MTEPREDGELESLRRRLAEAEQVIGGLLRGEIDSVVVDESEATPVLLRAAQQKLRASEQLLRAVFEGASDAMLIADDEGRYVDANPAACRVFGLEKEQLLGKCIAEFAAPDYVPSITWDAFIRAGELRGHFPLLRPDGIRLDLEYSAVANVLPGLHLSVLRDVTERNAADRALREAEKQLRASEARFRAMIEKSQDGISLLDANVRTIYQSPAVERMLGYKLDQAGQMSWADFLDDDQKPIVGDALERLMKAPSASVNVEFRIRRADGERRWLEVTGTNLLHDPDVGALVTNFRDVTEKKALERERERFFGLSLDMFCVADFDGRLRALNSAWERALGWSSEEITSRPWTEFLHPDDVAPSLQALARLAGGQPIGHLENRYRTKSGGYRILQWALTPSLEDRAIFGVARDVTVERAAAARDRILFDENPVPMTLVDLESLRFIELNAAALAFYGYSRDEMLRMSLPDIVVPEEQASLRDAMQTVRSKGMVHISERRQRSKSGAISTTEVTGLRLRFGDRVTMLSVLIDITARKHIEEELRASEHRYRRIVDNAAEGIWTYDASAKTTFMNRRMAAMLGCTPEEAIGKPIAVFMHDDLGAQTPERLARAKSGIRESSEMRLKRTDGTELWVSLQVDPLLDDEGKFEGALAMLTDITEQRRAALALKRSEEQLRQSQKMEAVGNLAGGIAHDFNNLLSVILSYTEVLLGDLPPTDPMRADLDEVRKAGLRATDLTRQLLAFSRKQMLQPTVVDVNHILLSVQRMLGRLLGEDIELSFLTSPLTGKVHADPGQLEQVIINLVVNARDAMPRGGKLTIETRNVTFESHEAAEQVGVTPGQYVLIAVTDTGVGMDRATKERIFEPFFTTKDKAKGTGLGLSTVYGIVQQSGGHILVYSELGKGTTFKVYLPRTDRELAQEDDEPPPNSNVQHGSETILLVEDETAVRTIMCTILRRHGYNVLEAQNGGEAFLLCEQFGAKIHLLLTDVVMPRMSGRQLAERLAQLRPDLKVLYISGYTEDTVVHHGILDAGIEFLAKPITPDALLRKVRQVLDRRSPRTISPSRPA